MVTPNQEVGGKVVLVTGSNGDIGRELVLAFRAAGVAEVIEVGGRNAPDGVNRLDVTDAAGVFSLASSLEGKVDILVNSAGINDNVGILSAESADHARREMEVNYFGLLNVVRAFAPPMRDRRQGVIVNMLSILSHVNLPICGSYCASKAAAYSLTQAIRGELAPYNVRVCGVFPAAVDTRMSIKSPPPKLAPKELANHVILALREGIEDLYPGVVAERMHAALRSAPKSLEKALSARLPEGTLQSTARGLLARTIIKRPSDLT
ncbi:SDR family NAD(P)-dependent oxidoreductase [Bradyrhizobium sp. NP1]|uniref:SDR family NAD(P)-dependent oxidoreductase n=1 Tax=Bradyrhizobium sp. NP1 TaxID=3049772 RepID=UPI0025A5A68E|nr:SDR family NAD(P)-dependent oxidoreductase [Bradyrhizobium sp. NP1]WJR75829.1 SDR family NAD(P)-dependent oxidoreductase [Bradyrhizobium sp. NP1]